MAIEWIHPSWRDLLIEHLVAHPSERQGFLGRCGVPGILLAVSRAGGSAGKREFPLLTDADDWNLVAAAIGRNVPTASLREINQLFSAIIDAIHYASAAGHAELAERLGDSANRCLNTCRARWDQSGKAIPRSTLQAYYQLTVLVRPLLPGPLLKATWSEAWDRVAVAFRELDAGADDLPLSLTAALELAQLVEKNEPRFLAQVDYPAAYTSSVSRLLDYADADLRADPRLRIKSDFDDRYSHLDEMRDLLDLIASEYESLGARARELAAGFQAEADSVSERKNEEFPESSAEDDDTSTSESEEFDPVAVFRDL